nr:putative capsid protein [Myrmica rubra picorna-like virus 7]
MRSLPGSMCMGEKLTSVFDLIIKFGRAENPIASSFYHFTSVFSNNPLAPSIPMIQFMSRMFVLARGSARYAADIGLSTINDEDLIVDSGVGYGNTRTLTAPEFELLYGSMYSSHTCPNTMIQVPYYMPQLFIPTTPILSGSYGWTSFRPVGATFWSRSRAIFNTHQAAGPDFMFAYLVPPPM